MVPFSSLQFGDVFRYRDSIAIKIYTLVSDRGDVKAINLEEGTHYASVFKDESTLVEPLNDRATLVIN
jgi:hypothetical protein